MEAHEAPFLAIRTLQQLAISIDKGKLASIHKKRVAADFHNFLIYYQGYHPE